MKETGHNLLSLDLATAFAKVSIQMDTSVFPSKKAAKEELERIKRLLKRELGGVNKGRNTRGHSVTANSNSTSGIAGVRAKVIHKPGQRPTLHFIGQWYEGPKGQRKPGHIQRSATPHGIFHALQEVLDARAKGTGQVPGSARKVWSQIKKRQPELMALLEIRDP